MEKLRIIKKQIAAVRDDIGDLVTHRALPTKSLDHIDPFLFLNHHGPQIYPAPNQGLPFGPHPHRGFETVTFILTGDLKHQDTGGHSSVIKAGGIQWMTAGRGLIHSETSSPEFLRNGGTLEILQLWVNLPAKLKMTQPRYVGLQKNEIPSVAIDEAGAKINLISGVWMDHAGAVKPLTDITLATIELKKSSRIELSAPEQENVFFYVVRGKLKVNGQETSAFQLVEFENAGELIEVIAHEDAVILFGHALPYNEPIVAHGPFVMNTREEIQEAIRDYQAGKFA
jgi:redox-sensitive bicupin YhaK (pirin superfamily)